MEPIRILIVGCGIAGPALASFLLSLPIPATRKPKITILERASNLRSQGQNIDIRGAGVTIMRKLGIENAVRSSTTGEEGVEWVDEDNKMWIALAADRSGKVSTPTADIEIMRGRLAQICYSQSKSISDLVQSSGGSGIEYLFGESISTIEQDAKQAYATFKTSGQRRSFDLVVGADGLQSQVRRLAWGINEEQNAVRPLGMYAAFFSMKKSPTDSLWRRWMHTSGRRGISLRPNQWAGRTTAFMYVVNDRDKRLMEVALDRRENIASQKAIIMDYFKDVKWENRRITEGLKAADDFYYDFIGQVKMTSWHKGRIVLMGDAGYCPSPLSGRGTTLALTGAYVLAGALGNHGFNLEDALSEYDQKLRPHVDKAQKLMPGFLSFFNPETAWGIWLMHWLLFILVQSRLLNLFIRFKSSSIDDLPIPEYKFDRVNPYEE